MSRKWTLPDGKTRDASAGPWVSSDDRKAFLAFCEANGHQTREHPDPFRHAWQIRHQGHWMGLLWNKNTRRYTADRRLTLIVQSFAATRPKAATPANPSTQQDTSEKP